jgi:membrane-associated phospholipid phosphatase
MKLFLTLLSVCTLLFNKTNAQEQPYVKNSVYKLNPWITVPIIVGGFVTNYYGVKYLKNKPGIDSATVSRLSPADVNAFDRSAAKQNPADAVPFQKAADIGITITAVLPAVLFADKRMRTDFLRISLIYMETMTIMANAYSWGVGHINRKRPYVFNTDESFERRTRRGSFNSFYAGHPASCAASTFFIVKVFHDYYPGSKLTPFLYIAAVIPPAVEGYFRYRAGMHFPTDIIAGIAGGAILGTIVPQLHKKRNPDKKMSLYPTFNGFALTVKL